jgi:hypothetical protein
VRRHSNGARWLRCVARQKGDERFHRGGRECHPKHSARESKQNAVGQKLATDASPRSAQREPGADLTVASRSARQKKTGHIQAGETQQYPRRYEQDPERCTYGRLGPLMAYERALRRPVGDVCLSDLRGA